MAKTGSRFPIALLIFSMGLAGCLSDGQVGEEGIVRFSQVLMFSDTEDFTSPIAAGKTVFVALQETERRSILMDPATRVDLDFRVETESGKEVDTVYPAGFSQYGVVLEDPGDYVFIALLDDEPLDAVRVRADEAAGIRLSKDYSKRTKVEDCTRWAYLSDGLEDETLHSNQSLHVSVVPYDEEGVAMLGLLPLSVQHDGALAFDAPLFGHGQLANALTILPGGSLGEVETLTVIDEDDGHALELSLATSDDEVEIECDD